MEDTTYLLLGIIFIIFLLIYISFIKTIIKTIELIAPANRLVQPQEAWYLLIPVFCLIWQFLLAGRLADSLKNEFISRKIALPSKRPTFVSGLVLGINQILMFSPILGGLFSILFFILFASYWIAIKDTKNQLLGIPSKSIFAQQDVLED